MSGLELPELGATLRHQIGLDVGPGYGRSEVDTAMIPLRALIFLVGTLGRSLSMWFPPFTLVLKNPHSFEGRLDR